MTFASLHQSNHSSVPVALYRFDWGNTRWTYCNSAQSVVFSGDTYEPIPVEEDDFSQGGASISEFTFRLPANLPVVALFRGTPPSAGVTITVRSIELDDPSGEAPIRWIGPISNVRLKDGGAVAEILSRINGLRRGGLRLTWGRGCQNFLYGPGCNVVRATYANARTITAIAGNVVTLNTATPSDGYFKGGIIEWDADGLGTMETRAIELETAPNAVRLFGRADGLTVGQAVTLYPGCARTSTACETKFNNLPNYSGLDFLQGKSPFDGTALG